MTSPVFVGSVPIYRNGSAWPSSLTISESDLPPGTQYDDTLIVTAQCWSTRSIGVSLYANRLTGFTGSPRYPFDTESLWADGFTSPAEAIQGSDMAQMFCWVARNVHGVLPFTVVPVGADGNPATGGPLTSRTWRLDLTVYRSARVSPPFFQTEVLGGPYTATAVDPLIPWNSGTVSSTVRPDTTVVAMAALPASVPLHDIQALAVNPSGYTEVHHTPSILEMSIVRHGGSFKVANLVTSSSSTRPQWGKERSGFSSFAVAGAGGVIYLGPREPDPEPKFTGWRIGFIGSSM